MDKQILRWPKLFDGWVIADKVLSYHYRRYYSMGQGLGGTNDGGGTGNGSVTGYGNADGDGDGDGWYSGDGGGKGDSPEGESGDGGAEL